MRTLPLVAIAAAAALPMIAQAQTPPPDHVDTPRDRGRGFDGRDAPGQRADGGRGDPRGGPAFSGRDRPGDDRRAFQGRDGQVETWRAGNGPGQGGDARGFAGRDRPDRGGPDRWQAGAPRGPGDYPDRGGPGWGRGPGDRIDRGGPGWTRGQPGAWSPWRGDRHYDWHGWRNQHRDLFRGPRYLPPRGSGWSYRPFAAGTRIAPFFYDRTYWIDDPYAYRLPPAYGPYRWVRYYNDVLLIDVRNGLVTDVVRQFFW